ncbi:MAG: DUF1501 domain-containing protein [Dokdonella sp.]|uniref:DUF1501 domain-containing protein n=1 Tax=Dokdonella sp. TaxID=2291710 RepID=UPI00326698E5
MHVNRRQFLRKSICAALGGASVYSAFGSLRLMAAAANARPYSFTDYKALVCVFMYGGNDSFNTIVPVSGQDRTDYVASRGGLALPAADLMPLMIAAGQGNGPDNYGLHPAMKSRVGTFDGDDVPGNAGLGNLFNTGKAAIVANVGSLLYPITQAQYQNDSVATPPQLYSHDDQTNQWQTSRPDDSNADGWGGHVADLLHAANSGQAPMSITLGDNNRFQRGSIVNPYAMNPSGVSRMNYHDNGQDCWIGGCNDSEIAANTAAYNALIATGTQTNVLERAYADATSRSIGNYRIISEALGDTPPTWSTPFQDTDFGRQLQMVARLISVRSALGMQRQVFFVSAGNFDTHSAQIDNQMQNLQEMSQALRAFHDATTQMGIADGVTAFTASDFGRSLAVNEDGTDHGWGAHHFVVGGAVRGQRFYGDMPSLARYNDESPHGNPDDTGGGQIIPRIAVDQYSATLARWFDVAEGDLSTLFPNLGRFGSSDLGFMM